MLDNDSIKKNITSRCVILGHFMDKRDLIAVMPWAKYLPWRLVEYILWLLPASASFRVVSHFSVFNQAEGWVIGIALMPRQMKNSNDKVRKKILAAVMYAQEKLGAEYLMLGALTAPATTAGQWLADQPQVKLHITTGNAYTAAITLQSVYKAIELAGLEMSSLTIAIVGATGTIGEAVSRVLNEQAKFLILVGRNEQKLERLSSVMKKNNFLTTVNLQEISRAEVVVTATSHPDALIDPQILKPGAIVIDVAEPSDMPKNIGEVRPDVINIDGGRVKWENIDIKFNIGTPAKVGFACITEGIMQALADDKKHHIGSIDLEYLKQTKEWGDKYGWGLADFTSFNKEIKLSKFRELKKIK